MAGAAASETIMFIGAMLAASVLVAGLIGVSNELSQGMDQRAQSLGEQMAGRIAVVNDPLHVDTSPLTLYVKNTGTIRLDIVSFVILVDGQASGSWSATVDGASAEVLPVGALATITVSDIAPGAGDHRVVVYTGTGASDTLEFTS